ncbi:MAG: prepilin-type N-terminal cleavage/methylation domain-containing protein [Candidatus Shapirobacteria bacterium]
MKQKGFTLVEILIVFAIIAIVIAAMVMGLNPYGILNRGKDARRKKDLNRIRVAFEEYFNDKGCYPPQLLLDQLMSPANCGSASIFRPWLIPWPCDPDGQPYFLVEDTNSCSRWFKILTNLENRQDADIPAGWYEPINFGVDIYSALEVNFGMSSTNVSWNGSVADSECRPDICLVETDRSGPVCNSAVGGCSTESGPRACYMGVCKTKCIVSCCGAGCE